MNAALPRVAVIGRQNVGKSTLVNRLFGRQQAIADTTPGVTRDRIEVETAWRGRSFGLVDTGGYLHGARGIEALVAAQADRAAAEADVIVLVVDAQAGVTEEDATLARRLRRATVPIVLVANKVDSDREDAETAAFHRLGLGDPVGVSALHGRASGDLLDRIVALLPDAPPEFDAPPMPSFAVVGRPNVGKSSLFNRLVGSDRSVVFEEAGTTRDSVDEFVTWPQGPVRFVDTAGMRRAIRVQGVEYYSFVRASRAIERADVAVLVVDAVEGFTVEDRKIAVRALDAGRALQLVANKWDLVEEKDRTYRRLNDEARLFAGASVMRTSALRGSGVTRIPAVLMDLHRRWTLRVSTAKVNEVIQRAVAERPGPRSTGKVHYATQVSGAPPTFVLFGVAEPPAGYRRYLENRLRSTFGFEGVPLRMQFRPRRRTPRSAD
jgi:GTP-binding protein